MALVSAARVHQPSGPVPSLAEVALPTRGDGQTLVRVLAASINPLEKGVAAGVVPFMRWEEPYVPGIECVGQVVESDTFAPGQLVFGEALPSPTSPGCMAEQAIIADDHLLPIPDGLDPAVAVGVGNTGVASYLPLVEVAGVKGGDSVLILGGTGSVGRLAVQIAREHGAQHVTVVGRDERSLDEVRELGAHATVVVEETDDATTLAAKLAAYPAPDLVLDALYGLAFEAAVCAAAPHARIVNIGQVLGVIAPLAVGPFRSKQLTIAGFASAMTPFSAKVPALTWIWDALKDGRIDFTVERVPLAEVASAWTRPYASGAKLVLEPR